MQSQVVQVQRTRSTFVSVLAWVFIVISGLSTFMSVLQNIMVNAMLSAHEVPAPTGPGVDHMPTFIRFMLGHIQLFFLAFLAVSGGTLIASVGLLLRKNWARLAFVGILSLGILWFVGGLVLQQVMFSSMAGAPSNAPPDFRAEFDRIATVMRVFSVVMALGFSALFAWLIKRLVSEPIRAEFAQAL